MSELVRSLGSEKLKDFKENFDLIADKYRMIANATGYKGELRFKKENGKMVVFVKLD
jgi:hypothetical protein